MANKTSQELTVELLSAMLEHNSELAQGTDPSAAAKIKPATAKQVAKDFLYVYETIEKLALPETDKKKK